MTTQTAAALNASVSTVRANSVALATSAFSQLSADEQFDEHVSSRIPGHAAAIRAKLAAGDARLVGEIDEAMSALLGDSKAWAKLIQATANGENAFAKLLDKAIFDAAELLALRDAEQIERARAPRSRVYQGDLRIG